MRFRKISSIFIIYIALSFLIGCNSEIDEVSLIIEDDTVEEEYIEKNIDEEVRVEIMINIGVKDKNFIAVMYDNKASQKFLKMLPITINMTEMSGNEKYNFTEERFPTEASRQGKINEGDIMLYGNNCLVIFYEDFRSVYSYTPLGYIENTEGLKEALGSGNVEVTFSIN